MMGAYSYGNRSFLMGASVMTTTETAYAALNQLRVDLDNLNADITAWWPTVSALKDQNQAIFINAWVRWRDSVYEMLADSRKVKIIPDLAWQALERVEARTGQLGQWRDEFQKLSGRAAAGPKPGTAPPNPSAINWKWITYGVLAISGVYAVSTLLAKGSEFGDSWKNGAQGMRQKYLK